MYCDPVGVRRRAGAYRVPQLRRLSGLLALPPPPCSERDYAYYGDAGNCNGNSSRAPDSDECPQLTKGKCAQSGTTEHRFDLRMVDVWRY